MPTPPRLQRAEPLVSASGVLSPALPPTPSAATEEQPYVLLRTLPRRHRSLRDKVGSQLKKLLARAKSLTAPDARARMDRPRAREFEDAGAGRIGDADRRRGHRRTLSDTSQFIDSVRRLARRSLSSVPSPSLPDSSLSDLGDKPSPPLELGGLHPNRSSNPGGSSPSRRPLTLIQTRSHASSTPRVEEEDETALEAYNSESVLSPPSLIVPESPTTYKDKDDGPYVTNTAGDGAKSLFGGDDVGSSSPATHPTPASDQLDLAVDEDLTPGTGAGPKVIDFGAPNPASNANSPPQPTFIQPQTIQQATGDTLEPKVPAELVMGTPMLKVTQKKTRQKFFKLDADQGLVTWESEKAGIINIENIKEVRRAEAARYYRELFKVPLEKEPRWLTISYTSDNKYKILHVVAFSEHTALLWEQTLLSLRSLRQNVMSGLVSPARMWERHYWRGADMSQDERLEMEEVERLCRRLNVSLSRAELLERFKSADKGSKGYLDFSDFRQFVKRLQARPEIKRLWNKMKGEGLFDLSVFENFMKEEQKQSDLPQEEIERMFAKYAGSSAPPPPPLPPARPASPVRSNTSLPRSRPESPLLRRSTSPAPPALTRTRSRSRSRSRSFAKLVPNALSGKVPPSAFLPSGQHHHKDEQNEEYTIAAGLAPSTALALPPHFTLDDFSAFLLSADNSAFGDRAHDMHRPLSEYYISSSHNTYLVGHQLVGESTIEGYIRALGSGCRSVEVDIWDGDTEPVITHGRTLTGSVPLRHVAAAIAKYAFVASPYPVIISAEMHAGIEQQSQVAAIFREAFGSALCTSPVEGSTWGGPGDVEELEVLPSPEQLKGRVLVKFKNALLSEVEVEDEFTEESGSSDAESVKGVSRSKSLAKRVRRSFLGKRPDPSELYSSMSSTPNPYGLDPMSAAFAPSSLPQTPSTLPLSTPPPTSPPRKKQRAYSNRSEHVYEKPKLKMSRSLADLLIYTVGVKFRGLNKKERYGVEQMFSLSEKTANKVVKENAMGLVKHARTNLVRLYPNGTRVASTNYEPSRYWAAGVQLVALNWQTIDLGNMMNQAMFLRNNRAGYLLKPEALRVKDCKEQLMHRTEYFLDITVISAQQVPRRRDEVGREIIKDEIMDPLVEVSLHIPDWPTAPNQDTNSPPGKNATSGRKSDGGSGKKSDGGSGKKSDGTSGKKGDGKSSERRTYRTTAVKNNGFNPVWEESVKIPFTCVGDMWDLVFVRFAVMDDDDDNEPLAMYCASLGSLRQGYRHLPLHDLQFSQYLFSTLFVHIAIRRA